MDLKAKLAATKTKLKKHAPVIAGAMTVAYVTVSVLYVNEKRKQTLEVTDMDLELMKEEDVNMCYSIKGSDYALRYLGNTPAED